MPAIRSLPCLTATLFLASACQSGPEHSSTEVLVQDAVALIGEQGGAAFDEFRTAGSRWFQDETYVFVGDFAGTILVNPSNRSMEGQMRIDMQDGDGKYVMREMLELVSTQGSGWIDYRWPKPGVEGFHPKSSFVMRCQLGDRQLVVGSGIYR